MTTATVKDWCKMWHECETDDEKIAAAETFIKIWVDSAEETWDIGKSTDLRGIIVDNEHAGNRAVLNLRQFMYDKNMTLVYQTVNELLFRTAVNEVVLRAIKAERTIDSIYEAQAGEDI